MPDYIGRIPVPTPTPSGLTWPLTSEYPFVQSRPFPIVTHQFGERAGLTTQRFAVGIGPRRFEFAKPALTFAERKALVDFYDALQGSFQSFRFAAPNADNTFTDYDVIFEPPAPLSITSLASFCRSGLTFVESVRPEDAPSYGVAARCIRFPNQVLSEALLEQDQQLIPLVHIKVRDTAVPDIYLSDRRVTIDNQLYLPRVLGFGEDGTDVIMSQDISGQADSVAFVFGNADRVMSALKRDTGLKFASIDLSFYHVQTGILLQLWKGIITSFRVDGSAQFRVDCSDGLYPITQSYPRRTIGRQCWKPFDKEIYPGVKPCPWSERGTGGDPTSCDYFFNSPNGCLAHGMSPYFGGHPTSPQSVVIHDEGTGHLSIGWSGWMALSPLFGGLQRATDKVTSTSIIADGLNGAPLPEIWCNSGGDPKRAFWANAKIVSTRDESTFQDSLGIVGAGPLGGFEPVSVQTNADGFKFLVAPMTDGFPPQGFKLSSQLDFLDGGYHPELGLRQVFGTDPATPASDAFSLGQGQNNQHWDVPDPVFSNIVDGTPHNVIPLAAGTAFCEMRYSKDPGKGLAPSTPESHTMQVPIKLGLTGVIFGPGGDRAFVPGLTNPFWVAVSTYLRALGIDQASPEIQLPTFVLESLTNFDSSGCAQIADLQVPPIIGDQSTTETQFVFQGVLSEYKPFRQWLTEILVCALGNYTFEFGRLRLGIRENARDTSTFTAGNMLYQSLSLTPAESAFEYLKIDFANVDLQCQQDMVEYQDKDYSAYFGRAGAPLLSRQRMIGLSFLSQGLRVVATRVREEIGGILRPDQSNPYVEWDNNDIITFKSTILALGGQDGQRGPCVGDVISITHPDVPTYPGPVAGSPGAETYVPQPANTWNYRIIRLAIHKDYSVTITAKSVTDAMYDLDVGPKPTELLPRPLPALFYAIPRGPVWAPHQVQADAADALFPSEWTFDADQEYTNLADNVTGVQIIVTGKIPVNAFSPGGGTPVIGRISTSDAGGSLDDLSSWLVSIVAYDSTGRPCAPSKITHLTIDSPGNTGSFTLSELKWPKQPGLASYGIFMADSDHNDLICLQSSGSLVNTGGNVYTPSSLAFSGPEQRSTYSLPSPFVSMVRVKAKLLLHSGVTGSRVQSVVLNTIISTDLIDASLTPFDPTGRVVSVVGRPSAPTPFASFLITAFNPLTGEITVDRDPVGIVLADDAISIRCLGYDNSATPTVFTDPGLENTTNSYGGLTTGAEVGNLFRIIAGKGRSEIRKIVSNTATSIAWDLPLVLDASSIGIFESPNYSYSIDTSAIDNADPTRAVSLNIPTDNYLNQPILIAGFTVDINGTESPDGDGPVREDWIFGSASLIEVDRATFGIGIGDVQTIGADLTNHFMVRQPNLGGTFIEALANCKTPGASADPLIIDIEKSSDRGVTWASIFGAVKLVIPPGSTDQVHQIVFANAPNNAVAPDDWLRVNLLSGSNEVSRDIEIVARWGRVPA